MIRILTLLAVMALSLVATMDAVAQCAACDDGCAACSTASAGCCAAPQCQAAGTCCGGPKCVGKAELVDVEKHCWKIECKEICIPAVRFPWERGGSKLTLFSCFGKKGCGKSGCSAQGCDGCASSGCASSGCDGCSSGCNECVPPRCGFVKTVRTLKKETFKEKVCEYSMEVADAKEQGCTSCDGGGCASCAAAPANAGYSFAPQQGVPHYATQPMYVPQPLQTSQPQYAPEPQFAPTTPQPLPVYTPQIPSQVPSQTPNRTAPVTNEIQSLPVAPFPSAKAASDSRHRLASQKPVQSKVRSAFKPHK